MNSYDKFAALSALDDETRLVYSSFSKQVYVMQPHVHIGNGCILSGIVEHEDTFEEAVNAYWARLTSIALDEYIVLHDIDIKRRKHYRWNGFMWEDLHWTPRGESTR